MTSDVHLTPRRTIATDGGAVLHGLRADDACYVGFGEVYFSEIEGYAVRGWKRHREMTLNLLVPAGAIRFVAVDDRQGDRKITDVTLSRTRNYQRLTVPPMVWLGFQGAKDGTNLLVNLADRPHQTDEVDHLPLEQIDFDWTHHLTCCE